MISTRVLSLVCRANRSQLRHARSLVVANSFCVSHKLAFVKNNQVSHRFSTTASDHPTKLK